MIFSIQCTREAAGPPSAQATQCCCKPIRSPTELLGLFLRSIFSRQNLPPDVRSSRGLAHCIVQSYPERARTYLVPGFLPLFLFLLFVVCMVMVYSMVL